MPESSTSCELTLSVRIPSKVSFHNLETRLKTKPLRGSQVDDEVAGRLRNLKTYQAPCFCRIGGNQAVEVHARSTIATTFGKPNNDQLCVLLAVSMAKKSESQGS